MLENLAQHFNIVTSDDVISDSVLFCKVKYATLISWDGLSFYC